MRELKFRGWHSTQKKMYYAAEMANDQLTLLPTGSFINVSGDATWKSTIYPPDKFIPLQYTGLKDKNGKEIYEGDILNALDITNISGVICEVYWDDSRTGWGARSKQADEDDDLGAFVGGCEVIGNIYENPEFLK